MSDDIEKRAQEWLSARPGAHPRDAWMTLADAAAYARERESAVRAEVAEEIAREIDERVRHRNVESHVYDEAEACAAARPHRPAQPLEGPLWVAIDFLMPRPKSLMRAKDPAGELWHTGKPDRDNLEKVVLDALKQDGWFLDDALVCDGPVRKFYHSKTGVPGARITVATITELGA